ncbi:uncharacterized protein LOC129763657 [Toxorhynchites rutilus septentrionalis]|uniref:uncharacterized protein LOC129763657 n=1 Tax=Toxorhynchites rutilus septentrionalis TaxID=329112 RepID=UPI00247873E9|nr:uncharacterized protein LOC129763657 [Toxorhynchites rutilus septentrionalis]
MADIIIHSVRQQQASPGTVYHALYGHYFLGISQKNLAIIYGKSLSTIYGWIQKFESEGLYRRKKRAQVFKKFQSEMRQWLVELYCKHPLLFLDEAKEMFQAHFQMTISTSSVCTILHEAGLSWKTIERRAIQIRMEEIVRFVNELLAIPWDIFNLVFLYEVSIDNRGTLRQKGYGVVGKKLIFRGEFCRRARSSFLCFLGADGILDSFWTEGTFNRLKFFECCREFALRNPKVQIYPGFHSVWIMDGARIHCDANLIRYLRSIGIIPIFLPAYCPFFNPIEVIFGLVKKRLQRVHREGEQILAEVCEAMNYFKVYPCQKLFEHCGYFPGGFFSPEKGLTQDPNEVDLNIVPN